VLAAAETGDADLALRWLSWLNPLTRSGNRADCEHYRVEPYVLAGDIYSSPPFTGRGGWSWYSGSAAWFYRVAMERLLGIRRSGRYLRVRPCLPAGWSEFEVAFRFGDAGYRLQVYDPSAIDDEKVLFIRNGRREPGTLLELECSGEHVVQVFPDEESRRRRQSVASGATAGVERRIADS
jgi:cellobiose phosphorylase